VATSSGVVFRVRARPRLIAKSSFLSLARVLKIVISALSSRGSRAESLLSIGTIFSGSGMCLKRFEVMSLFDEYYLVFQNHCAYITALFTQGGWHRAVSHNVVWMADKDKICGRRTWHLVSCLPLIRQCRGLLMCVSLLLYKGSNSWRASKSS